MISGPIASVPECAPQERPATFSRGMQEQKPVNSDIWARAGTSITRKIHRLESKFQLIPVCNLNFLRAKKPYSNILNCSAIGYMSHFMLIGGLLGESQENLATTRSYDPDGWSDKVIKLPPALHKTMHTSLSYASASITDGAVVLCGGYEGGESTPTKSCRDY